MGSGCSGEGRVSYWKHLEAALSTSWCEPGWPLSFWFCLSLQAVPGGESNCPLATSGLCDFEQAVEPLWAPLSPQKNKDEMSEERKNI